MVIGQTGLKVLLCSLHIQENYLFQALKKHPAGYRDFDQYLGKNFRYGRRILMSQIKQKRPHPVEEPIEQLIELLKLFDYSVGHRIPIWLHTRPSSARRIKTSYRRR